MTTDHQILIAGAGPTGLTIACELYRRGVTCRIVDAAPPGLVKGSRAIGVSARSLEVLDDFGAAEPLVQLGLKSTGAVFYSRQAQVGRVTAAAVRDTRFPFMLTVPQPQTELILEQRLAELGGAVERQTELRELTAEPGGDHVSVVLARADGSTQTVTASWLIGADGAHSAVRKLAGIAFEGDAAQESFVIVDVLADGGPPPGLGHYHFHPDGLALVAPLPDGAYRLAATVRDKDEFTDPDAALAWVHDLHRRRIGPAIKITGLRDAGWGVATTRVRTRMAGRYRAGRCLIAGDAAHLFGPVGGQGMNGGIQDAQNLAWKLALVCLGHAGEALLDTYEAERRPAALAALAAAAEQTRVGTLRPWPGRALRDAMLRLGTSTGKLDQRVVPSLTQLGTRYAPSGYFGAGGGQGRGQRIADTPVGGAEGALTLYDLLRRDWFSIVVLGAGAGDEDTIGALAGSARTGPAPAPQVLTLYRESDRPATRSGALVDGSDRLHESLGVRAPSAFLVRPDQYIAASGPLADTAAVTDVLSRIWRAPDGHERGLPAAARREG